jgi:hypothetical protein
LDDHRSSAISLTGGVGRPQDGSLLDCRLDGMDQIEQAPHRFACPGFGQLRAGDAYEVSDALAAERVPAWHAITERVTRRSRGVFMASDSGRGPAAG